MLGVTFRGLRPEIYLLYGFLWFLHLALHSLKRGSAAHNILELMEMAMFVQSDPALIVMDVQLMEVPLLLFLELLQVRGPLNHCVKELSLMLRT